jgi:hypothetical protein
VPRYPLPRLNAAHATKLRAAITAALDDNGKTLEDLGDAIDQGRNYRKRSIDVRTLRKYLSSNRPLARKVASELWTACASLGIYTTKLGAAVNEITSGDPRPLVLLVPSERRGDIAAPLAILGAERLATLQHGRTQMVLVPGFGLTTLEKGAEIFLIPKRAVRSLRKARRRN